MKKTLVFCFLFLAVAAAEVWQAEIPLVAVGPDGKGMVTNLTLEVVPGRGRTFFSSEPLIGIDTQNSERVAASVAERIANLTTENKDLLFTIHTEATIVDGASAGSAMALLTLAALQERDFRKDVMITGTIHEDGSIGPVGSVAAKAKAAADEGASIFFIPRGQAIQTATVQVGSAARTVTMNLTKIGERWGVQIVEVSNIEQVLPVFFGEAETVANTISNVTLDDFEDIPFLTELGGHEMARAEMMKSVANESDESYAVAEELLSEARTLEKKGYPYSVANSAFLAAVYFCRSGEQPELAAELDRLQARISHENRTKKGELEWLGSAQLRFLWARDGEEPCANAEWIAAANRMLDIMPSATEKVEVDALAERALTYLYKAEEDVASAKAIGMEDANALRSLSVARTAYEEGYFEASVLSSIDAMSYARASTASGPLSKMEELAVSLSDFETSGFAEAYRRHTLYLVYKGVSEDSRQYFQDAIYLGYRSRLYHDAFANLPTKQIDYVEMLNPSLQVLGFALLLSVGVMAIAKAKRRESENELMAKRKARDAALKVLNSEIKNGTLSEAEYDRLVRRLF